MGIYNITHASDLDGMASAALIVHYYHIPLENVIFTSYSGKLYEDAIKFLSELKGSDHTLVISDIGMVDDKLDRVVSVLSRFRNRGNRIIWLDHHVWGKKAVNEISELCDFMIVGENKDFCATELVYMMLCRKDKFGDQLARITHLADFALTSKSKKDNLLVDKVGLGIKYLGSDNIRNPKLRKFVSCIAEGNIDCKIINNAYKKYMKESRPYLKRLLKTATIIKVKGVSIAVGFGTKLSHQEACMEMLNKLKTSVSIYINVGSNTASIRSIRDSKSWGVHSMDIATAFLGGGHPLASGFPLDKKKYNLSNQEGQRKVIDRIEKVAKGLYGKQIKYYQQDTGQHKIRKVR